MQNASDIPIVMSFLKRNSQLLAGTGIAIAIGCVGLHFGCKYRAIMKAERHLSNGFALLAQEALEPYRKGLASTERGCRLLLKTYYQIQDARGIEYAAQTCLHHQKEIPEVYLAMASAREMTGKDQEAVDILSKALKQFDKLPEIPLKLGQIFQRNKQDKEALGVYAIASDRAPQDHKLNLDILQYAEKLGSAEHMKLMAGRLMNAPTDNPELKFYLAVIFTKVGDPASAKVAVDQGKELLIKNPTNKEALEKKYAALLNPETAAPKNAPVVASHKTSKSSAKNTD